jgi:hypothetical protein
MLTANELGSHDNLFGLTILQRMNHGNPAKT